MLTTLAAILLVAPVTVRTKGPQTVVDNGHLSLTVSREAGTYSIRIPALRAKLEAEGEVRLNGEAPRKTTDAVKRKISWRQVQDKFGRGIWVSVDNGFRDGVEITQHFWMYEGSPEAILKVVIKAPRVVGSNYISPILTRGPMLPSRSGSLNCLSVPYDNDEYSRYTSSGWDSHSSEVGAIYDDVTRQGVVIGSIDHDTWKSAVMISKDGPSRAFAGFSGRVGRTQVPHGSVSGKSVASPRFVVGGYADWRRGLERFGDLNAMASPPLRWSRPVPFGWNSWSGHKSKVTARDAEVATEFVSQELPWFRSGATAYVNLDSYWDNLTREERQAFVKRAHRAGLKAGIYWTPFVHWGELDWGVDRQSYKYSDLALRDLNGQPLPKLSGGFPLDPTHPGTLERIERYMAEVVEMGFDFIKFDFLSHGALEGRHHDSRISTGTAAYRLGMERIVNSVREEVIGRPFFIALSIAPLFPSGYGHSRRSSCDVFANIGSSEYLLNSQNYGWWTAGSLYRFNDPDHTSVYQPKDEPAITEAEARTRLTASVISGGKLMLGDDLTNPEARKRTREIFSNLELLSLARLTPSFRPVSGSTGSQGGEQFVWVTPDRNVAYVALFNFSPKLKKRVVVPLSRLGLSGRWETNELWTRVRGSVVGEVRTDLPPMDCALLRLTRK